MSTSSTEPKSASPTSSVQGKAQDLQLSTEGQKLNTASPGSSRAPTASDLHMSLDTAVNEIIKHRKHEDVRPLGELVHQNHPLRQKTQNVSQFFLKMNRMEMESWFEQELETLIFMQDLAVDAVALEWLMNQSQRRRKKFRNPYELYPYEERRLANIQSCDFKIVDYKY